MEDEELQPWEDGYVEAQDEEEGIALPDSPEALAAMLAAARAEGETSGRGAVEADFNKRRSDLDRSRNQLLSAIRENGLDITEGGKLAPVDPQRAFALIAGAAGQATREEAPAPSLDDLDVYDGAKLREQVTTLLAQAEQRAEERATKAAAAQFQQLAGITLQMQQPNVERAIAEQFADLGLDGLHETPEFREWFRAQSAQCGPEQLASPQWMASLASAAIPFLPAEVKVAVREKAAVARESETATRNRQDAAAARTQLGSSGAARTDPRATGTTRMATVDTVGDWVDQALAGDPRYDDFQRNLNRAHAAPDLADGTSAVQGLITNHAKAKQTAGARR